MSAPPHRCLVTGGARSGKSHWAEARLAAGPVRYLATGYPGTLDEEWAQRVGQHQRRRPASWRTIETLDVAKHLSEKSPDPLLVDCLTLWLTRTFDRLAAWSVPVSQVPELVEDDIAALVAALAAAEGDVVLVTNEVGWGVVPESDGARVFADTLGALNRRIAAVCEEVVLLVAGVPLTIKDAPSAGGGAGMTADQRGPGRHDHWSEGSR